MNLPDLGLPDPPPPKISLKSTLKIIFAYCCVVVVRSLNQFFISDIIKFVPPTTYLGIRAFIAFFLFIPVVLLAYKFGQEKDKKNISNAFKSINRWDAFLKLGVMGVFESSIPLAGYSYADLYLPADVATVLMSVSPLCSFFFKWVFPKVDPELPRYLPTKKVVLGICIGFIGAAIVVARPYLSGLITHHEEKDLAISQPWVVVVFVLAVLSLSFATTYWSTYGTYVSPKKEKIGVFVAGLGRNFWGFWVMFPLMFTMDYFLPYIGDTQFAFYPIELTKLNPWVTILWMSFGPAFINVMCYYYLVQKMGAEKALTTNYVIPVLGNIIGLVYNKEYLEYNAYDYIFQFGGAVVVCLGLVLCTMDGLKRRKEPRVRHHVVDNSAINSDSSYRGPTTSDTESGWDIASFKKYPRM